MTLRELLTDRGIRMDAAAVLGRCDKGTISRIAAGKRRAQPETIVAMARALGISARRMQAICNESWDAAHSDERIPA